MENKMFNEICKLYNVLPKKIDIIRNEKRFLVKIEAADNHTYFLKGEKANHSYWEACCEYATFLLDNGLNVTNYIKSSKGTYTINLAGNIFSLELALVGDSIEEVNEYILSEMGRLLGIQHLLSLNFNTVFSTSTSWSLFGGNATQLIGDYDENELSFFDFKKKYESHQLYSEIEDLYVKYRSNLQHIWHQLPQGAVQGDFCYYNMLQNKDGDLAIYDFNLAGNEIYLNECVAVAIYHSWHLDYEGTLNPEQRFQVFINAYQQQRPFTELEWSICKQLKAIIRAFRFDRVEDGIELENTDEQKVFMENTLKILLEV